MRGGRRRRVCNQGFTMPTIERTGSNAGNHIPSLSDDNAETRGASTGTPSAIATQDFTGLARRNSAAPGTTPPRRATLPTSPSPANAQSPQEPISQSFAPGGGERTEKLCHFEDGKKPEMRTGTLYSPPGGKVFIPDGEFEAAGARLHNVKVGDKEVFVRGGLIGGGEVERKVAAQMVLGGLRDDGKTLELDLKLMAYVSKGYMARRFDDLVRSDISDQLSNVERLRISNGGELNHEGAKCDFGAGIFNNLPVPRSIRSVEIDNCGQRGPIGYRSGAQSGLNRLGERLKDNRCQVKSIEIKNTALDWEGDMVERAKWQWVAPEILGFGLPQLENLAFIRTDVRPSELLGYMKKHESKSRGLLARKDPGASNIRSLSIIAASNPPDLEHPLWNEEDFKALPEMLACFPNLRAVDLSGNVLDLNPFVEAMSRGVDLSHLEKINLEGCTFIGGIPWKLFDLPVQPVTELKEKSLGLTHSATSKAVRFTEPVSQKGSTSESGALVRAGRSMTMMSLDDKNRAIHYIQRDIITQLDHIYQNPQLTYYYEMAKLAAITLLEGAQILRTGVRSFDPKINPSMAHSAATGSLQAVGPATAAAMFFNLASRETPGIEIATSLVPGVGSVLNFVFERYASVKFSGENERLAKALDMAGRNIRFWADTMSRAMTFLQESDLTAAKNQPDKGRFWSAMGKAFGEGLKGAQEFISGRKGDENKEETLIRLLATGHMTEIVMAMATGTLAVNAGDKTRTLDEIIEEGIEGGQIMPYETDQAKVRHALEWHAAKHVSPSDDPLDLDKIIVWGELEGVLSKKDLDNIIAAKERKAEERRLRELSSSFTTPTTPVSGKIFESGGGSSPTGHVSKDMFSEVLEQAKAAMQTVLDERVGKLEEATNIRIATLETDKAALEKDKAGLERKNAGLEQQNAGLEEQNATLTELVMKLTATSASPEAATSDVTQALEQFRKKADIQQVGQEILEGIDDRISKFEQAVASRQFTSKTDFDETAKVLIEELEEHRNLYSRLDQRIRRLEEFIRSSRPQLTLQVPASASGRQSEQSQLPALTVSPVMSAQSHGSIASPSGASGVAEQAAAHLRMTNFTLEEMSELLTTFLMSMHENGEAARNPKFANGLDFNGGEPRFKRKSSMVGGFPGRQATISLDSVTRVLRHRAGPKSDAYTVRGDLTRILDKLGLAHDHPELVRIGTQMMFSLRDSQQSPSGLQVPDNELRSPLSLSNSPETSRPLESLSSSPIVASTTSGDGVFYRDGDDGHYPFHHEVQSGADCGVHALNTFNHGAKRMTAEEYAVAAAKAREQIQLWGQDSRTDAHKPGTHLDEMAIVLSRHHGRQVRYLETSLGSAADLDRTIAAAFELLEEAADNAGHPEKKQQIEAITKEVKAAWGEISKADTDAVGELREEALRKCLDLAGKVKDADKIAVGTGGDPENRLDARLKSAIDGAFGNAEALLRHRDAVLHALFDREAGKARGELILQMGDGHGKQLSKLGLGHIQALRWDKDDGTCYLVDSMLKPEDPLSREPMTAERFRELLGDCAGLEFIIPDNLNDPLLRPRANLGQGKAQEFAVRDAGQGVGVGPQAWNVLADKLRTQLDEDHMKATDIAETVFKGLPPKPGLARAAKELFGLDHERKSRMKDEHVAQTVVRNQTRFNDLLESAITDRSLLRHEDAARGMGGAMRDLLKVSTQQPRGFPLNAFIHRALSSLDNLQAALEHGDKTAILVVPSAHSPEAPTEFDGARTPSPVESIFVNRDVPSQPTQTDASPQ